MFWKKKAKRKGYKCSVCGKVHDELPALTFSAPDYYEFLNEDERLSIAEFSADFCIIKYPEQIDRFIRTVFTVPITDSCQDLDYGVWVSVSEKTFDNYRENFENNEFEDSCFGMISNEIRDYQENTLGLHVNVEIRKGGIRPEILPHDTDHQLIRDLQNGISLKEANLRIEKLIKNDR